MLWLRIVLVSYHNNNLGGIEPNVIYGIQRVIAGQPLYQDPASGSFAIIQYTPLYYQVIAMLARPLSISATDVQGIYELCRTVALLCNLLTVLVLAGIFRLWQFSRQQSLLCAAPLLVLLTSHYFTRGDSLHLLLFSGAVYMYSANLVREKRAYLLWSALCVAACICVKQSGILAVGIIGFHLLFVQKRMLAAVLFGVVTSVAAAAMLWWLVQGNWHMLYLNAWLGLKNGVDLSFLYKMFADRFYTELDACYVAGALMVVMSFSGIKDKLFRFFATGIVLSWLFAVVTGTKVGSSSNYFVEFLLFFLISMPYALQQERTQRILLRAGRIRVSIRGFIMFAFLLVAISKTIGQFTGMYIEKRVTDDKRQYEKDVALFRYFKEELHIAPGEHIFFLERNFLDNVFMDYAILPVKDVVSQVYLADTATFSYASFVAGMNNGLVKYIVADERRNFLNMWHRQIPFIAFRPQRFLYMDHRSGYSIYVYNPQG